MKTRSGCTYGVKTNTTETDCGPTERCKPTHGYALRVPQANRGSPKKKRPDDVSPRSAADEHTFRQFRKSKKTYLSFIVRRNKFLLNEKNEIDILYKLVVCRTAVNGRHIRNKCKLSEITVVCSDEIPDEFYLNIGRVDEHRRIDYYICVDVTGRFFRFMESGNK